MGRDQKISLCLSAVCVALALGRGCDGVPGVVTTVEGPRHVVILHETEDETTQWGLMVNGLRVAGPNQAYLELKKHRLDILDDPEDEMEKVPPLITKLQGLNVAEPAIFILDADDDPVMHSQTIPPNATAADVMAIIKSYD